MPRHQYPTIVSLLTEAEQHERKLRNLAIRRRHERWMALRRASRRAPGVLAMAILAASCLWWVAGILWLSPWPLKTTLRHHYARASCDAARSVGLAPARQGQPGYWSRLDADADGVACELIAPDRWEDPRSYDWQPWRRPS